MSTAAGRTACVGARVLAALASIDPGMTMSAMPLPDSVFWLRLGRRVWSLPLGSKVYRTGPRSRYVVRPDGTRWRFTANRPNPVRLDAPAATLADAAVAAGRWPEVAG